MDYIMFGECKEPTIAIMVKDGMVQSVYSNTHVRVMVFDLDNHGFILDNDKDNASVSDYLENRLYSLVRNEKLNLIWSN